MRACSSHARAVGWCGWSLRDAATSTFTSGVTISGLQQGLVAQSVKPRSQPTLSAVDGQAHGSGRRPLRTQAQLQSFLDQTSQARVLLSGQRFGLLQQRVIQVEWGLHGLASKVGFIQISVLYPQGATLAIRFAAAAGRLRARTCDIQKYAELFASVGARYRDTFGSATSSGIPGGRS